MATDLAPVVVPQLVAYFATAVVLLVGCLAGLRLVREIL